MKKLVIFGASAGAVKVIRTLKNIGISVDFLTDNDVNKWGKELENIPIIQPDELRNMECNILIASDYQEEIELQLRDMNLLDRLILKEEYIIAYLQEHLEEARKILSTSNIAQIKEKKILIDLIECTEYGGIEIWSYMVGKELTKKEYDVLFLGEREKVRIPDELQEKLLEQKATYEDYWTSILNIADKIIESMPCNIIINRQGQTLIAAILVNHLFPNQIKIISMIHTDRIILYRRQAFLEKEVDYIMGVSKMINQKFVDIYRIPRKKIRFKESPVEFPIDLERKYSDSERRPIRIGYAARITKTQKRADLLPQLIQLLKEKKVFFKMQIAGEGSYLPKLRDLLQEESTVEILGQIDRNKMKDFWKNQDVFINVSEFEGTSLSMLEAMAYGTVPIVTKVSGVDDIICEKENGFICEQHNIQQVASNIEYLSKNRDLIQKIGKKARETINKKCNCQKYVDYIEEMIM